METKFCAENNAIGDQNRALNSGPFQREDEENHRAIVHGAKEEILVATKSALPLLQHHLPVASLSQYLTLLESPKIYERYTVAT